MTTTTVILHDESITQIDLLNGELTIHTDPYRASLDRAEINPRDRRNNH